MVYSEIYKWHEILYTFPVKNSGDSDNIHMYTEKLNLVGGKLALRTSATTSNTQYMLHE